MERESFCARWRSIHGPIAARIQAIRRYEQNYLHLDEYEAGGIPRHDGLAITWFDSIASVRQGATTEAYALSRVDEHNFYLMFTCLLLWQKNL
jgi:uncharacterized protein (TIGR02118 family)